MRLNEVWQAFTTIQQVIGCELRQLRRHRTDADRLLHRFSDVKLGHGADSMLPNPKSVIFLDLIRQAVAADAGLTALAFQEGLPVLPVQKSVACFNILS